MCRLNSNGSLEIEWNSWNRDRPKKTFECGLDYTCVCVRIGCKRSVGFCTLSNRMICAEDAKNSLEDLDTVHGSAVIHRHVNALVLFTTILFEADTETERYHAAMPREDRGGLLRRVPPRLRPSCDPAVNCCSLLNDRSCGAIGSRQGVGPVTFRYDQAYEGKNCSDISHSPSSERWRRMQTKQRPIDIKKSRTPATRKDTTRRDDNR